MTPDELSIRIPESEFIFIASRSSGPGGQNVNKVNTKVELRFNIQLSDRLLPHEKEMIFKNLGSKINASGELVVKSQSERSQLRNRRKAVEKMLILISGALTEKPERKPSAPTEKSQADRLEVKRKRGITKKLRKDSGIQED